MAIEKIQNGITGAEAAKIIYENDMQAVTLERAALPEDKQAQTFDDRVNPNSLWGGSSMKFNKARPLESAYFYALTAGPMVYALCSSSGTSLTVLRTGETPLSSAGWNQLSADQVGIDDAFMEASDGDIYLMATNSGLSEVLAFTAEATGKDTIFCPLTGGAVSEAPTVNLGMYLITSTLVRDVLTSHDAAFNMQSPPAEAKQMPYDKSGALFPEGASNLQYWGDDDLILGPNNKIYNLSIIGNAAGPIDIVFARVGGSTANILHSVTVTATSAGKNTFTAADLNIPESIYDYADVRVLAANNNADYPTAHRVSYRNDANKKSVYITKGTLAVGRDAHDIGIFAEMLIVDELPLVVEVKTLSARLDAIDGGASISNETDLQNYINSNRNCRLPAFDVTLSKPLTVPNGTRIEGALGSSIVRTPAGATFNAINLSGASSNVTIKGVSFVGGNPSNPSTTMDRAALVAMTGIGTGKGIFINGYAQNIHISNCYFYNFAHSGLHLLATHTGTYSRTCKITDNIFQGNFVGLFLDRRAEYHTITGNTCSYNRVGCYIEGGNNIGASNHMEANTIGLVLSGLLSDNDSHGSLSACTFNHNVSYSIYVININNGFTLNGCHCFQGDICLDNAKGFVFTGGIIACGVQSVNEGSRPFVNQIYGNTFVKNYGGGTISGTKLSLRDNKFMDGSDSISINNAL